MSLWYGCLDRRGPIESKPATAMTKDLLSLLLPDDKVLTSFEPASVSDIAR